ncbi:hypothetical protein BGZ83_002385 [Gryganskiella cystojenkinii]|nr:hypothetical protein BGZ83_002385 [Gryganskiella cystojenkinii]
MRGNSLTPQPSSNNSATLNRPLSPDPSSVFSFPSAPRASTSDLSQKRGQPHWNCTFFDVIKDDPFHGIDDLHLRRPPAQEPLPADPALRCFWFMRRLEQTMTQGGFLSKRLYIPPQVWYQKHVVIRIAAVETKIQGCQQLSKMLDDLLIQSKKGIITLLIPGGTTSAGSDGSSADRDQDRLLLLKELEALEIVAVQVWTRLSKKLSFVDRPGKHQGSLNVNTSTAIASHAAALVLTTATSPRSDSVSAESIGSVRSGETQSPPSIPSLFSSDAIAGSMSTLAAHTSKAELLQPSRESTGEDEESFETLAQDRIGGQFGPSSQHTPRREKRSFAFSPENSFVRKSFDGFIRNRDRLPYDHSMFVPIVDSKRAMAGSGSNNNPKRTKKQEGSSPKQMNVPSFGSGSGGSSSGGLHLHGTDLLTNQFKHISMSIQKSILFDKIEDTTDYTEAILHLFQSSAVLESMLKHYSSLEPLEIHLQFIGKLRRLCDFLYSVVCTFVIQDLQELVPKYLKHVAHSVPEC